MPTVQPQIIVIEPIETSRLATLAALGALGHNVYGISPEDGRRFFVGIGPEGGGWGAKSTEDGVSVTVCINDGDTHNSPTEQLEAKYPVLVEKYEIRKDSAGAGRHRGGLGAEMVVQALSPFTVTPWSALMAKISAAPKVKVSVPT